MTQAESPAGRQAALLQASELLAAARRVWLGTHFDPDGDAIGSLLGLGWILRDRGQAVTLACQDPPPPEVAFLPAADQISARGPDQHEVAVALDAADLSRLGTLVDEATWQRLPTVVLDHHVSNSGFGQVNVIDPSVSSTSEVVVALADAMGTTIGRQAATCLLTGLVTDTLGFRTSNTSIATLACAQRLAEQGASLPDITQQVFFNRPLAHLLLAGRAIAQLHADGPLAVAALARSDFEATGATPAEAHGLSSLLSTAAELAAVAVLRERVDGTIDVSIRSKKGVDVVPAALALGGGGHPQAAGARIAGPLDAAVATVLDALRAHVVLPTDGQGGR